MDRVHSVSSGNWPGSPAQPSPSRWPPILLPHHTLPQAGWLTRPWFLCLLNTSLAQVCNYVYQRFEKPSRVPTLLVGNIFQKSLKVEICMKSTLCKYPNMKISHQKYHQLHYQKVGCEMSPPTGKEKICVSKFHIAH